MFTKSLSNIRWKYISSNIRVCSGHDEDQHIIFIIALWNTTEKTVERQRQHEIHLFQTVEWIHCRCIQADIENWKHTAYDLKSFAKKNHHTKLCISLNESMHTIIAEKFYTFKQRSSSYFINFLCDLIQPREIVIEALAHIC